MQGSEAAATDDVVGAAAAIHLFVGSHSHPEIAHLSFALDGSGLKLHEPVGTEPFPRTLAWNKGARVLYAGYDRSGRIASFRLDASGGVTPGAVVTSSSPGAWPVSLALHPSGRWLLVGHYENEARNPLSVVGLDSTGEPTGPVHLSVDRCDDTGTFRVAFDPAGRFAFAMCDDDGLYGYSFEQTNGTLTRLEYADAFDHGDGSGIIIDPSGKVGYIHSDFGATITAWRFDAETGSFSIPFLESVSFAIPGEPLPYPPPLFMSLPRLISAVTMDPAGRFLFGANRLQNAIAVLAVGPDGRIAGLNVTRSLDGDLRRPVHAVASGDGRWLFVANEETGTIVVFKIESSGGLTRVGTPIQAIAGASFIVVAD